MELIILFHTWLMCILDFQILLRCSWSPDGRRVSAGSSDRHAYIWDTTTRHILYKLPGHNGSVNTVEFHPKEPIGNYRRV